MRTVDLENKDLFVRWLYQIATPIIDNLNDQLLFDYGCYFILVQD